MVLLLVGSEVAMLWVIFTQEAAAVLFLWLPILFLVAVWRDLGRTTWERLKTGRLSWCGAMPGHAVTTSGPLVEPRPAMKHLTKNRVSMGTWQRPI